MKTDDELNVAVAELIGWRKSTYERDTIMNELERQDWDVIVKTDNGHVSLMRNLPLAQAVKIFEGLNKISDRVGQFPPPGAIREKIILGPEGWDGCHKGMQHQFDLPQLEDLSEPRWSMPGRPGVFYSYMACSLCGESKPVPGKYVDASGNEVPGS